jgi:hypothetical protein
MSMTVSTYERKQAEQYSVSLSVKGIRLRLVSVARRQPPGRGQDFWVQDFGSRP